MFNSPRFEQWWPLGASVAVVLAWYGAGAFFPPQPEGLFSTAATVAAVFASFLGVAKAIILSIQRSRTYKILKELGHTTTLFSHLRDGIVASIAFAGLSIVGFFISHERIICGFKLFSIFEFVWVFFAALSLFTYVRISNILFKLLKIA
jgi:hypothetical protein